MYLRAHNDKLEAGDIISWLVGLNINAFQKAHELPFFPHLDVSKAGLLDLPQVDFLAERTRGDALGPCIGVIPYLLVELAAREEA